MENRNEFIMYQITNDYPYGHICDLLSDLFPSVKRSLRGKFLLICTVPDEIQADFEEACSAYEIDARKICNYLPAEEESDMEARRRTA